MGAGGRKKKEKEEKKKDQKKTLGQNHKTSRVTDGMPNDLTECEEKAFTTSHPNFTHFTQ